MNQRFAKVAAALMLFSGAASLEGSDIAKPPLEWVQQVAPKGPVLNIRDFGAKGDGVTNDTEAFRRVALEIEAAGGGTLVIPKGTYIVGEQLAKPDRPANGVDRYYLDQKIFTVSKVSGLLIEGNGATIKLASGLRFGAFDLEGTAIYPETGYQDGKMKLFTEHHKRAAVGTMIQVLDSEDVVIRNLELDGNSASLVLGGSWGDTGRQLEAYGIRLMGNRRVVVENVHTHHHGLDGILIGFKGLVEESEPTPHYLRNVVSEYNARQGLSWVGGIGVTVTDSKFNHTGKGAFASAPGAGLDVEAEESVCRKGYFENCEFINNAGSGMVSDSGNGGYSTFVNCTFWGTTSYSVWSNKPGMYYVDCRFYGSGVHTAGSDEPTRATRFLRCRFEDKPWEDGVVSRRHGQLYTSNRTGNHVSWEDCEFIAHEVRSVWVIAEPGAKVTLTNCLFTHGNSKVEDKGMQALLAGVTLRGCRFTEDFDDDENTRYWINAKGATVELGPRDEETTVDGPRVRWGIWSEKGSTGVIPPQTMP